VVSQRSVGDLTGLSLGSSLEILDRIGRGGMGSVYLALHRDWRLYLAVKSPRPDLLSSDTDKERWLLEAQTWIDLGVHPNIVRCWFIREHNGIPLLFLDYVAGGSLKEAIDQQRFGVCNWTRFLDLAIQVCFGLEHAHASGIVHRDVKPANFLLDDAGRVYVTDFGLVKLQGRSDEQRGQVDLSEVDASLTSTGTVLGTPNYCAPEQWMQHDVGVPADLYAVGVVLYEMCVGQLPFEAGTGPMGLGQLLTQVLTQDPTPPSHLQPSIPPRLEAIILRLLAKEPKDRHASAAALREDLIDLYQELAQEAYFRPLPKPVEAVVDVLNNKAVSLFSMGRRKPAEQTWQQALRLDSLHPDVVYNRGWLMWRQGRTSAQELATLLRQVKVTYPRGAVHCGLAHLLGGEAEQAEANLTQAIEAGESLTDSSVWRHLGDACMTQERFTKAAQCYHRALQLNPSDELARSGWEMAEKKTRRKQGRCFYPRLKPLVHLQRQHRLTQVLPAGGGWLWLGPEHMELLPADSARRSWSVHHDIGVRRVALSMPASRIVSLESLPAAAWDFASGSPLESLEHGERYFCLSPSGEQAVVGLVDLRLQDLRSGESGRRLRGHEKQVLCALFCGDRLVTGSCDRTARCWDPERGACLQVFSGHRDYVTCLAYSAETNLLLTGSNDHQARTWRLDTGEQFRVLEESAPVTSVAFASRGKLAVLNVLDGSEPFTSVYDLRSGEMSRRYPGFSRVSPDGDFLVLARQAEGRQVIEIREVSGGCIRRQFWVDEGAVSDLAFSEDGRFFAAVTLTGHFFLYEFDEAYRPMPRELLLTYTRGGQDLEESRELFVRLLRKAEEELERGDTSGSRKTLDEARQVPGYRRDPQARLLTRQLSLQLGRGALNSCWEVRLLAQAGGAGGAPICPLPGQDLLLTANEKILRLWDSQRGNCIRGFPGHSESIRAMDVSRDGSRAVSGSLDRGVRCWDMQSGECLQRVAVSRGGVIALHWLPDSARVLALTNQYYLCGLDFDAAQEVFQEAATGCTWMVGSGGQVVVGGPVLPGRMMVVDARTGQVLRKPAQWKLSSEAGDSALLASAAATYGEGRYVVTASPEGNIHLWDVQEGRHLTRLLEVQAAVTHLAISADGLCLALALENGWVQLWDLEHRALCQVLEGPWGKLTGLAMASDGYELYLLGADQVLRIWEMEWELLDTRTRRQLAETVPKAGLLNRLLKGFRG